jgi:hypothetical protein
MQTPPHHPLYSVVPFAYTGHWTVEVVEPSDAAPGATQRRRLTAGLPLAADAAVVQFTVLTPGRPMDVSVTPSGVVVASAAAADVLRRVAAADVQLLPARVEGAEGGERYVVNVLRTVRSPNARRFLTARRVARRYPIIPPEAVGDAQVFRIKLSTAVVVTSAVKDAIVAAGLVGPGLISLDDAYDDVRPGAPGPWDGSF